MPAPVSGGAADHRAAAEALDAVQCAAAAARIARRDVDRAIRSALDTPGVTQAQVAKALDMTTRGLRKRLRA